MGAGLPAIKAPRSSRNTEVMLSQASQLPHKPAPTFLTVFQISRGSNRSPPRHAPGRTAAAIPPLGSRRA
ncbi:hypothetical protein FFI16_029755 [Pseudomonas sp. KBS0710]|nr:hypothetical protein FFI16_029755 [Pseudomonas sp. KBS0710]